MQGEGANTGGSSPFRTADLWMAAYLAVAGMLDPDVVHTGNGRCIFAFIDTPEREALVGNWDRSCDAVPSAQSFMSKAKQLRKRIDRALFEAGIDPINVRRTSA